jgi:3D (Asp-Asp-Asp) domain-containing protein
VRVFHKNSKSRRNEMKEANKYYVTVAVDHCVIPRGVMIYAENEEAAVKRAEMKIALQMRDAITVKAINVRDG